VRRALVVLVLGCVAVVSVASLACVVIYVLIG
jgi:hypothetical protein